MACKATVQFWPLTSAGCEPFEGLTISACRQRNLDGAAAAAAAVRAAKAAGGSICAFFCESALSCAGQIVLPEGYLAAAFRVMKQHGAACICDEVQTGFGRLGDVFWGFEGQVCARRLTSVPLCGFGMGAGAALCRVALYLCQQGCCEAGWAQVDSACR